MVDEFLEILGGMGSASRIAFNVVRIFHVPVQTFNVFSASA